MSYNHNKVTSSEGVVFVHTGIENKWKHLPPDEHKAKFKEEYVALRMKNAKKSKEEAEADFDNLNEASYKA